MTAPVQQRRCWRGPKCTAAYRDVDELVGAPADRPLCDACETEVRKALGEAPRLYVGLRAATLMPAQGAVQTDYVTTTVPGSKVLGDGRARALGEDLAWLLTRWETIVRGIAGLTPPVHDGKREQARVTDAATLLSGHLTAWTCAPAYILPTSRWTPDTEQTGVAAAAALLDWRQSVRRALGHTRLVTRRDEPCMYCEVRAIVVDNGSDDVRCESCRRTWDRSEYLGKVRGFAPYLERLGASA